MTMVSRAVTPFSALKASICSRPRWVEAQN
jgi:hypothetical protein